MPRIIKVGCQKEQASGVVHTIRFLRYDVSVPRNRYRANKGVFKMRGASIGVSAHGPMP